MFSVTRFAPSLDTEKKPLPFNPIPYEPVKPAKVKKDKKTKRPEVEQDEEPKTKKHKKKKDSAAVDDLTPAHCKDKTKSDKDVKKGKVAGEPEGWGDAVFEDEADKTARAEKAEKEPKPPAAKPERYL